MSLEVDELLIEGLRNVLSHPVDQNSYFRAICIPFLKVNDGLALMLGLLN
jgi:hypothetical protein